MAFFKRKKQKSAREKGGLRTRLRTGIQDASSLSQPSPSSWLKRLKTAFALCLWILIGAGIVLSFGYLNQYIFAEYPQAGRSGPLELINVPDWVEPNWIQVITEAAGGSVFPLNEDSARQVAEKLSTLSWLDQVRVQATPHCLRAYAVYRKPVLRVKIGSERWVYFDQDGVVLDAPQLTGSEVIELRGLPARQIPSPGSLCRSQEVAAALKLLEMLNRMDQKCCPDKPLLREIAAIDVSNWSRGKKSSLPQIVLAVKDGTPIHWGAPYGQAALYLEADEAEKLSVLYTFYTQNGYTLQGKVKYLELRTPISRRPRPK